MVPSMRVTQTLQSKIVQKHFKNDHPLLRKFNSRDTSIGGFDTHVFSSLYELSGLANQESAIYLPHFEFNVVSRYAISVDSKFIPIGTMMREDKNCTYLNLTAKNGAGLIPVSFPKLNGLFDLRNKAIESGLSIILQVSEKDRERLPISEKNIRAGFTFRMSSLSYGQYYAKMELGHLFAEEVISNYFNIIDTRFLDYRELQHIFKEKDNNDKTLGENQQSEKYIRERKKLNHALVSELTSVLTKASVEFRKLEKNKK